MTVRESMHGKVGRASWDQIATVLVSLAIAFSWLPAYLLGLPSELVGLTRWVAMPLMLLSMVIEPDAYLPVLAKPQVIVLGFATVVGIGGGVAAGTIPTTTLVSFIPSLLVVVFYARKRSATRLRGILVSLLVGSWLLCGVVVLAGLGMARTGLTVSIADVGGGTFERTWAGVSSSLLGPWVAILLGSLGGFALYPRDTRKAVLVTIAVGVSAFVVMVTAQRSVVLVAASSLLMGCVGTVAIARKQATGTYARSHVRRNAVLILLSVTLLLAVFWPIINGRSFTLRYRFTAMETTVDFYGGALRWAMWEYLAQDLIGRPQLTAPGDQGMVSTLSMGPHLILGESYYYGGLLMLVAMLMLMVSSVTRVFRAVRHPVSNDEAIVARIVLSALVPTLLYLMIMPGLVTRLPYVLMGLALGLPSQRM